MLLWLTSRLIEGIIFNSIAGVKNILKRPLCDLFLVVSIIFNVPDLCMNLIYQFYQETI